MKFLVSLLLTIVTSASPLEIDWDNVTDLIAIQSPLITTPLLQNVNKRVARSRIINGKQAPSMIHFPHQAGFLINSSIKPGMFWCGGAIISKDYVLTAAHCLNKGTDGYLYLGCLNRRVISGDCKKMPINSANYIVHSGYDEENIVNDIALIRIPFNIIFSTNINKTDLYKSPIISPDQKVVISGWGHTGNNNGLSDILNFAYVKVIDETDCRKYFNVGPTQICQGVTGHVSICQGDSGGPMSIYKDGKVYLVGLTSYGPRSGCSNDLPRVFTRISAFLQWICDYAYVC